MNGAVPMLRFSDLSPDTARMSAAVEAVGVPVFHAVRDWVAAAGALAPLGR